MVPYKDPEKAREYQKKRFLNMTKEQREKRNKYYRKKYHENVKESRRKGSARTKKCRARNRSRVLIHYGGNPPKCACCGESHIEFLTIDHIHGGGTKHIRGLGGSLSFYYWLIRNNFPEEYQVLCYNCNCAKGRYGYCPHQKNKE